MLYHHFSLICSSSLSALSLAGCRVAFERKPEKPGGNHRHFEKTWNSIQTTVNQAQEWTGDSGAVKHQCYLLHHCDAHIVIYYLHLHNTIFLLQNRNGHKHTTNVEIFFLKCDNSLLSWHNHKIPSLLNLLQDCRSDLWLWWMLKALCNYCKWLSLSLLMVYITFITMSTPVEVWLIATVLGTH